MASTLYTDWQHSQDHYSWRCHSHSHLTTDLLSRDYDAVIIDDDGSVITYNTDGSSTRYYPVDPVHPYNCACMYCWSEGVGAYDNSRR
jgi:hypothetical protein